MGHCLQVDSSEPASLCRLCLLRKGRSLLSLHGDFGLNHCAACGKTAGSAPTGIHQSAQSVLRGCLLYSWLSPLWRLCGVWGDSDPKPCPVTDQRLRLEREKDVTPQSLWLRVASSGFIALILKFGK